MLRSTALQKLERWASRHIDVVRLSHQMTPAGAVGSISTSHRSFSSVGQAKKKGNNNKAAIPNDDDDSDKKQPFVTAHLEPGEWDVDRTDPYHRPKVPKMSRLISAEDFANRPPVAFDNEFSTFGDAMISLGWIDQKTCRQMYQIYVDMMILSEQQHSKTSHEYVTRVIAQKFNISTWRAAGIIQLQHAEEQMKQHNPELLCEDQAKYAEQSIMQNIRDAYRAERTTPPSQAFMEDPVGIHGRGELDESSTKWTKADDIYDLTKKVEQATIRDSEKARLIIDGHVYKEDTDDSSELVPTDASAKGLVRSKESLEASKAESSIDYPATNGEGVKRARWKYVAKVVNTRKNKKKGRVAGYTNNNIVNTLVEEDGNLRVATVSEAKQVAWKKARVGNQHIYEGAKDAWLEKKLHGKSNVWGRPPITRASDAMSAKEETDKEQAKKAADADDTKSDESGKEPAEEDSSDSSDDSDDSSDSEGEVSDDSSDSDDSDDDDDDKKKKDDK